MEKQEYTTTSRLSFLKGDLVTVTSPMVRFFANINRGDIGLVMKKTPKEEYAYNVLFSNGKVIMVLVGEIKKIDIC